MPWSRCGLQRQTFAQASVKRLVVQAKQRCVILQNHLYSLPLDNYVIPAITRLLVRRGPPTVFRRIVAVYIFSVKRVLQWTRPHILQKLRRVIGPSVAHGDAPTTVVRPFFIVGVLAARFCVGVRLQLAGCFSTYAMTMCDRACRDHLGLQASTRPTSACTHSTKVDRLLDAAVAFEKPSRVPIARLYERYGSKAAIFFASYIESFHAHIIPKKVTP